MEDSGSKKLSTKQEVESIIKYLFENPPKELVAVSSTFDTWIDKLGHLIHKPILSD